jgi:D-3-phosphoglycerate dehydrogenase
VPVPDFRPVEPRSAMTTRSVALVTAPFRGPGLTLLQELVDTVVDPWIDGEHLRVYDADQLAARAHEVGADVLVVEADLVQGPVFDVPLRAVGACRGDPNNVDVAAATARGIPVLHAPGRNADAVAELTVGILLAVTRGLLRADRDVREGEYYRDGTIPYQRFRGRQIAGRTAGIIGLGAVGRAVRARLQALGMRVIAYDPYNPEATHALDELLAEADVVSVHAARTPETAGMIGARELGLMREGAIYLNTARGELHDLDALVEHLASGHLGGAGLDHFAGEFLAADHPLCALPNVVLTPHIGGATYDTEVNHSTMIAEGLATLFAGGRPSNIVNPEVLA